MEQFNPQDQHDATVIRGASMIEQIKAPAMTYDVTCTDAGGNVKWTDRFTNVVTTEGVNKMLDVMFGGSGSTTQIGTWYMGLISATSYGAGPVAGDTAAQINGTNGWREGGLANSPVYTGNRPTLTWNAASAKSKALTSAASFSISSGTNVIAKGLFIVSSNTKDGTTGVLYSAGLFSGGDKTVSSGDTLQVSGSLSA